MSQRFVDFSWKGRRYRVWDEGADMVSLERIQKGVRRPVQMPGTDLLEAGKAALDNPSIVCNEDGGRLKGRERVCLLPADHFGPHDFATIARGSIEPDTDKTAPVGRPRAGEKLVLEGFLPHLTVREPYPDPFIWNGAVVARRYRVTVEEIPEDDAVIVGRLLALQESKQANRYDREAVATWARSERYRLSPDHLPPGVRAAKAARLEALVSLAESIPKRGGLTKKNRPAAWDEFEMLRKHLTPNARGVRHTDIADGGELEWMVRHAQTMLASYAERCSEEGKHALRQKIRDGITACLREGQ